MDEFYSSTYKDLNEEDASPSKFITVNGPPLECSNGLN